MTIPVSEGEEWTEERHSPLSSLHDWVYLAREFDHAYRRGSAGGSGKVRSHMKQVRDRLAKILTGKTLVRFPDPAEKPVTAHLRRAIDNGLDGSMRSMVRSMVRAIGNVRSQLAWEYGYERMPRHLQERYAYADIMGPKGPIISPTLTLGLVLFAPRTTYPAHSHQGKTESYLSLSGHWSENDNGVYAPGSIVLNLPQHTHTITTADREPVLLAYAWCGDSDVLSAPGMRFSRRPKTPPA
ncbi:MAG: dimethylsulfoniopropionate lyase [Alphaproteobacteria bacterium]|nr:dimethylsulfoniopropionate lyase [Alphaproteobacteria bacterium]